MYTAGVLDVFMENDISFDKTVGVSAGAVFGCSFHSGQHGRALRYNKKYCRDKRYMSFKSLVTTGDLFGAQFCYYEIPERLDPFDTEYFSKNPGEFYVVATDVNTGEPLYHLCTDGGANDIEWMRASASMPLVSRIVEADGYEMLDGGISDSIPLRWMLDRGVSKAVLVLTRPESYRKEKAKVMQLIRAAYRKHPGLIRAMAERHTVYNQTLDLINEMEREGKIFVIRPEKALEISRLENNPEVLQSVYDLGREDAEASITRLKEYLSK